MTIFEFPIDSDTQEDGIGSLFITDSALLVRPRKVPDQYPATVNHDTEHAYRLLHLGNDMNRYMWHIIHSGDLRSAQLLLDRVFYAYVDACCLDLWCDARVCYIVDGQTVYTKDYGFYDGQYTMIFNVYCNVDPEKTEEFLRALIDGQDDRFVVARSDDSSESGYKLQGFEVEEDDDDDEGLDDFDCPWTA